MEVKEKMIPIVEIEEIDGVVFMPAESLTERFQNLELCNEFYCKINNLFIRDRITYKTVEETELQIGYRIILVNDSVFPLVLFEKPVHRLFFINMKSKEEQKIMNFLTTR